jgi:hypothetical protein
MDNMDNYKRLNHAKKLLGQFDEKEKINENHKKSFQDYYESINKMATAKNNNTCLPEKVNLSEQDKIWKKVYDELDWSIDKKS